MRKISFTSLPQFILDAATSESPNIRSKAPEISRRFSDLVVKAPKGYIGTKSQKRAIVNILNTLSLRVIQEDDMSEYDDVSDFYELPKSSDDFKCLGKIFIDIDMIIWDVEPTDNIQNIQPVIHKSSKPIHAKSSNPKTSMKERSTSRSDISFEFPEFPSIDTSKVWAIGNDDAGRPIPIYTTLPEIPEIQRDISITTDVSRMSSNELLHLYPKVLIQVRRPDMYVDVPGFTVDPEIGFIPKISGYTEDQVIDNIIKYPQFNYMYRIIDGKRTSFMKYIEIEGQLLTLEEASDRVEDMSNLPDSKVYYWDYIVRRYLLERDIKHIEHKYPLYGSFDEFMTLFAPQDFYIKRGYQDVEDIARKCVSGRVRFYQTRNPLVRRLFSA